MELRQLEDHVRTCRSRCSGNSCRRYVRFSNVRRSPLPSPGTQLTPCPHGTRLWLARAAGASIQKNDAQEQDDQKQHRYSMGTQIKDHLVPILS